MAVVSTVVIISMTHLQMSVGTSGGHGGDDGDGGDGGDEVCPRYKFLWIQIAKDSLQSDLHFTIDHSCGFCLEGSHGPLATAPGKAVLTEAEVQIWTTHFSL